MELNFRVRNGNGWVLLAFVTDQSGETGRWWTLRLKAHLHRLAETLTQRIKPIGQLVLVSSTHRCASTSSLSTSWSSRALQGELILRGASHLDAFSGYPVRTWLPGSAVGTTTGTPEVRPSRSSRTKDSSSQLSYAHDR